MCYVTVRASPVYNGDDSFSVPIRCIQWCTGHLGQMDKGMQGRPSWQILQKASMRREVPLRIYRLCVAVVLELYQRALCTLLISVYIAKSRAV
jgi:hypothetical protein